MKTRIHTIATHFRPHLDEIAAIWFLVIFGGAMFPGIRDAKIVYWTNGGETPDGRNGDEWEKEGVLCVGVGGGRFDEHPAKGQPRKKGKCAATLVAKALGLDRKPEMESILKYVLRTDENGGQPFCIATTVNNMHDEMEVDDVFDWAILGLKTEYEKQKKFWSAKADFMSASKVIIGLDSGKKVRLVSSLSNNDNLAAFARSSHGFKAGIVIRQDSRGNTQILTNNRAGLSMTEVAVNLRKAEMKAAGLTSASSQEVIDEKALAAEGKVEGAERWFYFKKSEDLLNGSKTATDVPPTRLSLSQIKEIVIDGVRDAEAEEQDEATQEKG